MGGRRIGRCFGDNDLMFYFWLGLEAEQYHDIEDDGFITIYA